MLRASAVFWLVVVAAQAFRPNIDISSAVEQMLHGLEMDPDDTETVEGLLELTPLFDLKFADPKKGEGGGASETNSGPRTLDFQTTSSIWIGECIGVGHESQKATEY